MHALWSSIRCSVIESILSLVYAIVLTQGLSKQKNTYSMADVFQGKFVRPNIVIATIESGSAFRAVRELC